MQNSDNSGDSIVIDTYAWIEYFKGSVEGERAKKIIEGKESKLFTPTIVVAELSDKYRREEIYEWVVRKKFIMLKTKILQLDIAVADDAGRLKQDMRKTHNDVGLADAIIAAHAESINASILTGDKHLKGRKKSIDITSS